MVDTFIRYIRNLQKKNYLSLGEPKSAHPESRLFGSDIWFEKTHGGFSKFFDLCMKIVFRHY